MHVSRVNKHVWRVNEAYSIEMIKGIIEDLIWGQCYDKETI